MRTIKNLLIAALTACVLLAPTLGHAQTVAVSVTLSAAVTGTAPGGGVAQSRWQVSSTANILAGYYLFLDGETVLVNAVPASGYIDVSRGQRGTSARAHASGERAIVIPTTLVTQYMKEVDPDYGAACTRGTGQSAYSPWINTVTATVWMCVPTTGSAPGSTGAWRGTRTMAVVFDSIPTSY